MRPSLDDGLPGLFLSLGRGRAVRTDGSRRFHAAMRVELPRPNAGSNIGPAVVHGSQQSPICAGGLLMLVCSAVIVTCR